MMRAVASVVQFDSAGRGWRRYVNQRFIPVTTFVFTGEWPPQNLLLHETATSRCCQPDERGPTLFEVDAFIDSGASPRLLWHATVSGDAATVWAEEFYRVTIFGCCALSDTEKFISLRTGRIAFVSTAVPLTDGIPSGALPSIELANRGRLSRRFIAFHDRIASEGPSEAESAPDLVGVLQYGGYDGATSRLLLRCPNWGPPQQPAPPYVLDSIAFRIRGKSTARGTLWPANAAADMTALSGFDVHIVLIASGSAQPLRHSIDVPVEQDSLRVANASLPPSCRLVESAKP
jgi:hypothetical protein